MALEWYQWLLIPVVIGLIVVLVVMRKKQNQ